MSIIAVDFDGCLCSNAWPEIGVPNLHMLDALKHRREEGDKVILWTCRSGDLLEHAVDWCRGFGLEFDAINANLPENIKKYGNDCRKVWADEYWDDKAVQVIMFGERICIINSLFQHAFIPFPKDRLIDRLKRRWNKWHST